MNVYVVLFVLISVSGILSLRLKRKVRRFLFFVCAALVAALIAFRDRSIGADTEVYLDAFIRFLDRPFIACFRFRWEPGLLMIMKLIGLISPHWQAYIIVLGLLSTIPVFIILYKKSEFPLLSLLVFYVILFRSAEYLNRQWLAAIILLFSYKYIQNKKPLRFLFFVAIAMLFHRSAVIFAATYLLNKIPVNRKTLICSIPISMLLAVTGKLWMKLFGYFVRTPISTENTGGATFLMFLWACIVVAYILSRRHLREPEYALYFRMLWFAAVTQPLVFSFHIWSRIVLYYYISAMFIFPQAVMDMRHFRIKNLKSLPRELVTAALCVLLFVYYALMGIREFIPMGFGGG